tara:strand:+ start:478 stop:1398 length:921 start_codon:yes stop_codon:yes gene_type:complete
LATDRRISEVKCYFESLQKEICEALETRDGKTLFSSERIESDAGGYSIPRVLNDGDHIERGAVQYTYAKGMKLPAAATERNPGLAERPYEAVSISMIIHPRNPYVPTFHANLRFFLIDTENWHFGGGFDLTPFYPFPEDVLHWHRTAKRACDPYGYDLYEKFKAWCDEYFFLPHRKEQRGVGGLFFDDWNHGDFAQCFGLVKNIGDAILEAYLPIFDKRIGLTYTSKQREFQLYRRGRYVEFNLSIDRGTKYGIQSGRRIESVLASMPPIASWNYNWKPEKGSPEADLYDNYLRPRDWLRELNERN